MADRRKELGSFLDREARKLLGILNELEEAGKKAISDGIEQELSDARKRELLAKIKGSAVVTDGKVKDWLAPAMSGMYISGLNYADTLIKKFGFDTKAGKVTVEILKQAPELAPHLQAVNALMSDAYLDFGSGITGWIKGSEHILNEVIKRQVQSKIGVGRLAGESVEEIKKGVENLLKQRGLEALIDKGGRQWTLDQYGEMLTRTHLIRANTEATVNRISEFGIDIVEVSTHGTVDALCLSYEGNIYSLSGNSKNYPKLDQEPPFHPNCKHSLIPRPDLE